MARIPKIWFRKDRKAWFVTVRGVRHNLGPDKKAASDRFHQLMREPDRKPVRSMSFVAIADAFLDWVQTHRAKKTYEDTRYYIQSFCRMYPELMPVDLRPFHCERWADSRGNISQSTRRNYLRSIKRVVNWANQQGYLDSEDLVEIKADRVLFLGRASGAINVGGNLVLVPTYGITAAGVTWAATILVAAALPGWQAAL